MLRRSSALIAIVCVAALGSGALQYLHELDHLRLDARQDAMLRAAGLPVGPHHHDESDCEICVQLHMAFCDVGWTILLDLVGTLIAVLAILKAGGVGQLTPARIDCRGPPRGLRHF